MDLYAEDLADYIYQENNVDKKRALLLEVEAEIKKLMGEQEKGSLDLRHIGAVQIEKIEYRCSTDRKDRRFSKYTELDSQPDVPSHFARNQTL